MKRVLFVNNYDMVKSRDSYKKGNSASHHQFGTNELIETGEYVIDYMLITLKITKIKYLNWHHFCLYGSNSIEKHAIMISYMEEQTLP